MLKKLQRGQANEITLEEGAGVLLVFTSLLWPGSRKTALDILSTDASWTAAFRAITEFADPSQSNLVYTSGADDDFPDSLAGFGNE